MSKGFSGLFQGTLGSTFLENEEYQEERYSDRGIDLPEHIQKALARVKTAGDYISSAPGTFGMMDVSIMSKETGVEFASVTVGGRNYLIRGDERGTIIPNDLLAKIKKDRGTLDFHSHPRNDDLIPSQADMKIMKVLSKATGQRQSTIVTPNGRTSTFNERGIVEISSVPNTINDSYRKALMELFGGEKHD